MNTLTPTHVSTGLQQIVMRLIGVMIENGHLTDQEARRIFVEAATSLRQHPSPETDGAAIFVDSVAKAFSNRKPS